ncbi:MAG: preprotein translocase subunit SecE [Candidatus Omnitrophica bacterium]|nr:preprotein translocase subunit SecE [Candidatus Omnitrophota bacterium]
MFKKIGGFFSDVKTEMKKVSWPSKGELVAATVVTFFFVAVLAVYVGAIDLLMSRITTLLLK